MSLTQILINRGHRISEYSNILALQLKDIDPEIYNTKNNVRESHSDEIDILADTVALGFTEGQLIKEHRNIFITCYHQKNSACFICIKNEKTVGGGSVFFQNGIAIMGGASVLPEYRNRGIQTDMLKARLKLAQRKRCNLAIVTTIPGSISQHNAEKLGFRVLYARTKFFKNAENGLKTEEV